MKTIMIRRPRISAAILAGVFGLVMLPACGSGNQGNTEVGASVPAPSVSSQAATSSASPAAVEVTSGNASPALESQKQNLRSNNANSVSNAPKPQIGTGGGDLFMFTQARAALSADAELKTANIVIEANSGALTLNGTVANAAQKSKAEQLVRAVAGVKAVKNQLRISN